MRKLSDEYPEIYSQVKEEKFVVKTINGAFNSVSPDMKSEQTIKLRWHCWTKKKRLLCL